MGCNTRARKLDRFTRREPLSSGAVRAVVGGGQRLLQLLRATSADDDAEARVLRPADPEGKRNTAIAHMLPESKRVAALLHALRALNGDSEYRFSTTDGIKPMHHTGFPPVLAAIGKTTPAKLLCPDKGRGRDPVAVHAREDPQTPRPADPRSLACCLRAAGVAGNLPIRPRQNSVGLAPTAAWPPSRQQRCVRTNLSSREADEFVHRRVSIEGAAKHAVDLRHVETGEHGVVPVGQRPAARDDGPRPVIADGLELPRASDPFQVADMVTPRIVHPTGTIVDRADRP